MIFSVDSDVCFYPEEQAQMTRMLKEHGLGMSATDYHSFREKGMTPPFLLEEPTS